VSERNRTPQYDYGVELFTWQNDQGRSRASATLNASTYGVVASHLASHPTTSFPSPLLWPQQSLYPFGCIECTHLPFCTTTDCNTIHKEHELLFAPVTHPEPAYRFPALPTEPACNNTMASAAAQDEAIAQLKEELAFQGVLLSSIDETVLNRHEAEQEIKEEIKALKKQLRALQGTGAASSASQSQSSQPGPSNTLVPGSWPTDDIVESSTSGNNASGAAPSKMNRLEGQLDCLAFFCLHWAAFLCCDSLNVSLLFRSKNAN
jgi:uncharacterized coiled-coil protein SlyX